MKKRIVSLMLLTAMAMPIVQPIMTEYSPVSYASEETGVQEEYTSELNPVKPSEAADDYVINFANNESKEFIIKSFSIKNKTVNDDITVKDVKSLMTLTMDFKDIDQNIISLEGTQYARNTRSVNLKNGKLDMNWLDKLVEPVHTELMHTFRINGFNLNEIPKVKKFKSIPNLDFSNNSISNLDGLEYYEKLAQITMNSNNINDLSGLEKFNDQLTLISFGDNNIDTEAFKKAFSKEYPKLTKMVFSYNNITDTHGVLTAKEKINFTQTFFGKQNIFKLIDSDEFTFPLKTHYMQVWDENGEFIDLARGRLDTKLDKTDSLEVIDNENYRLSDKNRLLTTVYWHKFDYDREGYDTSNPGRKADSFFSGALNLINIAPAKDSIEEAKNNPSEENIEAANKKFNELKNLSEEIQYDELKEKVEEFSKDINNLNNLDSEYTSQYNTVPPSIAKDEQIVNFKDPLLLGLVRYNLGKEPDSKITVGDMKNLTEVSLAKFSLDENPIERDRLGLEKLDVLEKYGITEERKFESLEGLQYASSLKLILMPISKHDKYPLFGTIDPRDELLKNPEKIPVPEYTGIFAPIKNLYQIESIGIEKDKVSSKDLVDISKISSLKTLSLSYTMVDDLTPLKDLTNLEYLRLTGNLLNNTEGLENLVNLKTLQMGLSFIKSEDISFLSKLTKLEVLNISFVFPWEESFDKQLDISPVENLTNLRRLLIGASGLKDITPLKKLNNLEYLELGNNRVSDLSSLGHLKNKDTVIDVLSQVPVFVLEDGNYSFSTDLVDIDGNDINFLRKPFDPDIKRVSDGKYEITNRDEVRMRRSWFSSPRAGIRFSGEVVVFNKNKVEELVKRAKDEPTQKHIDEAESALDLLGTLPTQRTYVEEQKAALETLTPDNPETPGTPVLPPGDSAGGGSGSGSTEGFDFVAGDSTVKNGDKNVPINTHLMFKFSNAVSDPAVLSKNADRVAIYDQDGNKLEATVTAVPENVETPDNYSDRAAFERDYRRFLTLNVKDGLKENTTYKVVLRAGIEAKNGSKTLEQHEVKFSTGSNIVETPEVSPESVSLNKNKLTLTAGDKEKLTATVKPDNATNKEVTWSSSDDSVAKVDSSGNVEAVKEGKATITATVKGTDIKVSAEVTVNKKEETTPSDDVKATSVTLNSSSSELEKGDTFQLTARVQPNNSTEKGIVWTSSNNSVATVDSNGLVKAVGEGTATIRARVKNSEVSAEAKFTVKEKEEDKPVKAESIELDAVKIDMYKGQKDKIEAKVKPEKATNKEVEWSSSDDSIVKVDADGNIEAVGVGTATVTAKVKGTDITASVEIVSSEVTAPIDSKFTDIDGHWAKAYIEHSADRGLFKGTTETLFSPEMNMTRGMFVTVLGRLAEETAEPNDKFADVNKEAYYAEYIAWAEENGIVEGYGSGNFGPDNNVTREEMAAIIERYMKYKGIELEDNGAAAFADADSISDWAKESVTKIQKAGIIEGKGNGVFDPQANSTRAEVATLLIRMIEKYID